MCVTEAEDVEADFKNVERRYQQMISGDYKQTCKSFEEQGDIACIACSDYW